MYLPGATLDPGCKPTDDNCGVQSNTAVGTIGQVPYYAAAGNILAATSTFTILSNGNVGIGTTSPATSLDVNGIVRGTIQDRGGQVYNIKAYGAVGDGTTDNSASIQAAIDAASVNGGTVLVPGDGVYAFASQLLITKTVALVGDSTGGYFFDLNNINIKGSRLRWIGGNSVAILVRPSSSLLGRPVTGVVIRDLLIDGNNLATTALRFEAVLQPVISNVALRDCTYACLWIGGTTLAGYTGLNLSYGGSFSDIWISQRGTSDGNGIVLDGDPEDDYALNSSNTLSTFSNVQIAHNNGTALEIVKGDHNRFVNLNTSVVSGGTGYSVEFGAVPVGKHSADNNTFFGFFGSRPVYSHGTPTNTQGAVNNIFYGYSLSRSDGATIPTVEAGSSLYWSTDEGEFNFRATPGPLTIGMTAGDTAWSSSILSITNNLNTAANTPLLTIASTTGGTSTSTLMTVLANGQVGIGTNNPASWATLDVNGSMNVAGGLVASVVKQSSTVISNYFMSDVGIGTTTPYSRLSVWGAGTGATSMFELTNSASTTLASVLNNGTFYMKGNVGIGTTSPTNTLGVAGFIDTGPTFGYKQNNNLILYASSTIFSTFGGVGAGTANIAMASSTDVTSGPYATAFGFQAMQNATSSAYQSTAIGYQALQSSATISGPGDNTAVGYSALRTNTSGTNNTAIGISALTSNTGGSNNIGIGRSAGLYNQSGSNNTLMGMQTANGVSGNSFSNNSFYGAQTGFAITNGSQNLFLGKGVASTTATGSSNIAIGYDIALPSVNGSNQLNIGNLIFGTGINGEGTNLSTGNIGIGTTTPNSRLTVWGPDTIAGTAALTIANSANTTEFQVFDNGNATLAGTLTQTSDERLKQDINPLDGSNTLAQVTSLNPVSFVWRDTEKGTAAQLGLIAQDVQQIFPNLVSTTSPTDLTPGGTLGVNYIGLISPIIESIKELAREVNSLATTVAGFAQSFTSENITAGQKLCVGATCVTESQLKNILQNNGQSPIIISDSPLPSGGGGGEQAQAVLTTITVSTPVDMTIGGATQILTATGVDQNGASITLTPVWSSSDATVATVDTATGEVTAVSAGTIVITATSGTVHGDSATLTVSEASTN